MGQQAQHVSWNHSLPRYFHQFPLENTSTFLSRKWDIIAGITSIHRIMRPLMDTLFIVSVFIHKRSINEPLLPEMWTKLILAMQRLNGFCLWMSWLSSPSPVFWEGNPFNNATVSICRFRLWQLRLKLHWANKLHYVRGISFSSAGEHYFN